MGGVFSRRVSTQRHGDRVVPAHSDARGSEGGDGPSGRQRGSRTRSEKRGAPGGSASKDREGQRACGADTRAFDEERRGKSSKQKTKK